MDCVLIKESTLENHIHKCRCCLNKFEVGIETIQVTKVIEKLFYDFTGIELKNSNKYSNNICITCKKDLIYFSDLRRLLAAKQLKIYEFVEDRDGRFKDDSNIEVIDSPHNELLESPQNSEVIAVEYIKKEQDKETSEAKLIVETFKWPEIQNNIISENQKTFIEQISTQNAPQPKSKITKKSRKRSVEHYCEICKLFLPDKYKFNLHYDRLHNKIKNNICDLCGFSAFTKGEILSHIKGKHFPKELKEFPCPLCNKVLSSPSCRNVHIKSHEEKRNHRCEVCGLGFKTNINVKRHIKRIHHKVTDFKCNEPGCERAYYSKIELNTHIAAFHTKVICVVQLTCKYCKKLYNSEVSYAKHLKSHIDPQWGCDLCGEKFYKKGLLTNHKRVQHWMNP